MESHFQGLRAEILAVSPRELESAPRKEKISDTVILTNRKVPMVGLYLFLGIYLLSLYRIPRKEILYSYILTKKQESLQESLS